MRKQYNTEEISRILDKFMTGETSLAEEQLLADYFRTHEVSDEWSEYKEMFALFNSGKVDIEQETYIPQQRASTPLHYGRGWGWVFGIAAAVLIAFLLWPESHETPIKQPEQQSVIAEVTPPKPVPKEKVEAETPVSGSAETPQKTMHVSNTKRPQMRKVVAQATAITTTEENNQAVIIDAKPVVIEELPQSEEPSIPSNRQALADIYLAEVALQVAYRQRAVQEAVSAYQTSIITGEEPAQPIIAF